MLFTDNQNPYIEIQNNLLIPPLQNYPHNLWHSKQSITCLFILLSFSNFGDFWDHLQQGGPPPNLNKSPTTTKSFASLFSKTPSIDSQTLIPPHHIEENPPSRSHKPLSTCFQSHPIHAGWKILSWMANNGGREAGILETESQGILLARSHRFQAHAHSSSSWGLFQSPSDKGIMVYWIISNVNFSLDTWFWPEVESSIVPVWIGLSNLPMFV